MGSITFSPDTPDPFPEARTHVPADDRTLDEFGTYDIDLRPMLGLDITQSSTTTVFPGRPGSDILTEAEGHVHHRNEVAIALIPRMSHGGLSFTGTIEGDEVRGTWIKRDFAPTVSAAMHVVLVNPETHWNTGNAGRASPPGPPCISSSCSASRSTPAK